RPRVSASIPVHPLHPLLPYTTLFRSSPWCSRRVRDSCSKSYIFFPNWGITCSNFGGEKRLQVPGLTLTQKCKFAGWTLLGDAVRSEEHTSELQSRFDIVCRLLLARKT